MTWRDFCLGKAEECDLLAAESAALAVAEEWRLSAADWHAATSANDNGGPEQERPK